MSRWGAVAVGVLCALVVAIGPLTSYDLLAMAFGSALLPAIACVAALRSSRQPGAPRSLLRLTALSMGLNALAYVGFHLQWMAVGNAAPLTFAEPLFLAGYLVLLAGWVQLHRETGRDSSRDGAGTALRRSTRSWWSPGPPPSSSPSSSHRSWAVTHRCS